MDGASLTRNSGNGGACILLLSSGFEGWRRSGSSSSRIESWKFGSFFRLSVRHTVQGGTTLQTSRQEVIPPRTQLWLSGPEWLKTSNLSGPTELQMPDECQVKMKDEMVHGLLTAAEPTWHMLSCEGG